VLRDPRPSPSGEEVHCRPDRIKGDEIPGQAIVEHPLGSLWVQDAGQIDDCAGHACRHDALDRREVFEWQYARAVYPCTGDPLPQGPRRDDLGGPAA
jgi:hypothetical protein